MTLGPLSRPATQQSPLQPQAGTSIQVRVPGPGKAGTRAKIAVPALRMANAPTGSSGR